MSLVSVIVNFEVEAQEYVESDSSVEYPILL